MNNRYDEAMQCHHNAAELLLDAMKSTTSSVALESITLQHSYHLKQKDLIKTKKEQYARVKKAMDTIKCLGKDPLQNLQGNEQSKLQVAIYRAINETDSLLQVLSAKNEGEQRLLKEAVAQDVTDGKRKEKSQQTVVEELQILSQNLHSLVVQLVLQVEVLKDENVTLKERVNYLEKERTKYLTISLPQNDVINRNNTLVGIVSDGSSKDSNQRVPIIKTNDGKINTAMINEWPNQQANFDLTAFKNN